MLKILVCLLVLSFSGITYSADTDYEELLQILHDNGSLSLPQLQKLKQAAEKRLYNIKANEDARITTRGGFNIASYDGQFSFALGGRLMIDIAAYNEKKNQLGDGTELRRARMDMQGSIYGDWEYELGLDFAEGDADVKDAYIRYIGHESVKVTFGQHKEPFSLEELTSSKYISFMERALVNEFVPGRNMGLNLQTYNGNSTASIGLYGDGFNDDTAGEGDEGRAITARYTYTPYHSKRNVLHFGVALSQRYTDDENSIRYDARPESHITGIKYLNSDDINQTEKTNLYGLEFAAVSGPFSAQAEYMQVELERRNGLENADFDGGYFYLSWFVTGESRVYKSKKGSFGRVKPADKSGAIELLARYSMLDLNDKTIRGGREINTTLGINWYVNPQLRLMGNYIIVNNDLDADDAGSVSGNDDPTILQIRLQADF